MLLQNQNNVFIETHPTLMYVLVEKPTKKRKERLSLLYTTLFSLSTLSLLQAAKLHTKEGCLLLAHCSMALRNLK